MGSSAESRREKILSITHLLLLFLFGRFWNGESRREEKGREETYYCTLTLSVRVLFGLCYEYLHVVSNYYCKEFLERQKVGKIHRGASKLG